MLGCVVHNGCDQAATGIPRSRVRVHDQKVSLLLLVILLQDIKSNDYFVGTILPDLAQKSRGFLPLSNIYFDTKLKG